jgi:uncharacterized protein (TIGR02145 family)
MGNMRTEDGSGVGSFSTILRNLNPSTTYYVRSYAKNSNGVVVYGDEVSFSTGTPIPGVRCPGTPSVTDIDGNLYHTVQIGTQCWTQSNLKVSRYRNGDSIPTGLSNTAWQNTTAGAYAIYDNNPVNDGLYGKLYNHYAVMDNRGLCPTGWHVSTDSEWNVMIKYLDPNADTVCVASLASGCFISTACDDALKSTTGWYNNQNGTNSSGFTGLHGGVFQPTILLINKFYGVGEEGNWWSSSLYPFSGTYFPIYHALTYEDGYIVKSPSIHTTCMSVRCLRD